MSAFKYQWNQTIDVGTAGLLSKQWTSIRHILSLLVKANACVHVTAYVAVRRSLSTTYTAVVLGLLLRQYVSYQFGVWAGHLDTFSQSPLCHFLKSCGIPESFMYKTYVCMPAPYMLTAFMCLLDSCRYLPTQNINKPDDGMFTG